MCRERRFLSERAATSEEKGTKVGSHRRHGKSLSLEQSQELFANAAAPRQRLVRGWHAAVAGCVGVTSAPVPGGLKMQGCPSREEGHMQALTHCGNWAALAIEAQVMGRLTARCCLSPHDEQDGRVEEIPRLARLPLSFFTHNSCFVCFVLASFPFALNEVAVPFLRQPEATTALHRLVRKLPVSQCANYIFANKKKRKRSAQAPLCPLRPFSPIPSSPLLLFDVKLDVLQVRVSSQMSANAYAYVQLGRGDCIWAVSVHGNLYKSLKLYVKPHERTI